MKKALAMKMSLSGRRSARVPWTLPVRIGSALVLLGLLAVLGLFASRPARTAPGPVPVTVANAPLGVTSTEGQPVEAYISVNNNTGSAFGNLVYNVPAGKLLVVESMSLVVGGGTNVSYTGVVRNLDSSGTLVSLASLSTGVVSADTATATQPLHLHVGPGGILVTDVYARGTSTISGYISLSGYLIAAP